MSKNNTGRRKHAARRASPTRFDRERMNEALARAAQLDREADLELQHGHHLAAERLAWRAAEMRGASR